MHDNEAVEKAFSDYEEPPVKPKGHILRELIDNSLAVKKRRFLPKGKEIVRYSYGDVDGDQTFEYQSWDTTNSFEAKVAKTHQAIREFGPYLYQTNPECRTSVWDNATENVITRAEMLESYLNWTTREYDAFGERRRSIDDAISWGRGVVWHGLHKDKPNVVVSVQDSVENLLVDGDAVTGHEVNWVGRRRLLPRWKWLNAHPKARKTIMEAGEYGGSNAEVTEREGGVAPSTDLIEGYEIYMKVGLDNYRDQPEHINDDMEVDNSPRRYVLIDDKVVDEGDWPIPYHVDGEWPCTFLDFIDHPRSVWPISPLEAGLGWQKAINWAATAFIAKYRFNSRNIIAILKNANIEITEEQLDDVVNADDPVMVLEMLDKGGDDSANVNKYIQQIQLSSDINEALAVLDYLSSEYEKATGLNEILFTGNTGGQFRNAKAAELAETAGRSRIDDMFSRVEQWLSIVSRKEAMAARYLLDEMDMRPLFGDTARVWGTLGTEEMKDPRAQFMRLIQNGALPDMETVQIAQEQAANVITLQDWAQESEYTIEAGSTRRRTPEQEREVLTEAMNQVVPILLQSEDPATRANGLDITALHMERGG
ncbi:MAG: hypothetical protein MJH10_19335, partial [Epibacterium sp.]|nr:hypothetical protein [Epibacterium sp.]NQX75637.1 hypothetical protein [Epibacterium sp.]